MRLIPTFVIGALLAQTTLYSADPAEAPGDRLSPMSFELAREQALAFAAKAEGTSEPSAEAQAVWQNVEPGIPARGLHELVLKTFAVSDPATAELLQSLDLKNPPRDALDLEPVAARLDEPFYGANVRAHVARFLADARMYDESLALSEEIDTTAVVDPASTLFYRAVCEQQLLLKDEGLASLTALLERTDAVPESYLAVARLMQADLESLEAESLDEVAGLMRDVQRRLGLARAGQRVQKREDEIVAKLDEMIKKIEQQMSNSSSSSGGNSSSKSNQSSNPAQDSVVKGSTAPGEVDDKGPLRNGDWGDLPPREREQAKNDIGEKFPPHYNRQITEYFLKRSRNEQPNRE